MPAPLSCKSASALDSLPRHSNAKRSSTALNRLQLRKNSSSNSTQESEFGSLASNTATPPSPTKVQRSRNPIKKLSTSRKPSASKKLISGRALASNDLPLASSDLYNDDDVSIIPTTALAYRTAFSEGENDDEDEELYKEIRRIGNTRARSTSPTKPSKAARAAAMVPIEGDSGRSSPVIPSSPSKRSAPSIPARKRVVTKQMIGEPANFQHTSHMGMSPFGEAQGGIPDDFAQQLIEVTAALQLSEPSILADAAEGGDTIKAKKAPRSADAFLTGHEQGSTQADQITPLRPEIAVLDGQATSPANSQLAVPALKRAPSSRKPVPAPRNLAALYSEFTAPDEDAPVEAQEPSSTAPGLLTSPSLASSVEQVEELDDSTVAPLPTIRAKDGKRMVQGPAGEYITDTANGRWNSALSEITAALKAEGEADGEAEEELDIQEGLQRADAILAKLGA